MKARLGALLIVGLGPVGAGAQTMELHKLLPSDGAAADRFGGSAAISGDLAVIGAFGNSDSGPLSGSAYIFDASTGQQTHKLLPSDPIFQSFFGYSAAISGNLAVIGAWGVDGSGGSTSATGSAYVFNATTGHQLLKLKPSQVVAQIRFGYSVAIRGSFTVIGSVAVIGAPKGSGAVASSGSAYVFELSPTGQQLHKLSAADGALNDNFGASVAVSGDIVLVGAPTDGDNGPSSGSVYVFDITTGQQLSKLVPTDGAADDLFGNAVAIAGNYAVICAPGDDDNGSGSGSAYVFDVTTGAQLHKLLPGDGTAGAAFGASTSVSGAFAAVGASGDSSKGPGSGAVYLFDITKGQQLDKLHPADGAGGDGFGATVAIDGRSLVAGSMGDGDNGPDSGSAYSFVRPQRLLLAFDQPVPFKWKSTPGGKKGPTIEIIPGSEPKVGVAASDAEAVRAEVQRLFDDAGVDVVVDVGATAGGLADAIEPGATVVYFGTGSDVPRGLGLDSWQVPNPTGAVFDGIDQFNESDEGVVIMWLEKSLTSASYRNRLAAVIAHEAGHSFGLRHLSGGSCPSALMLELMEDASCLPLCQDGCCSFCAIKSSLVESGLAKLLVKSNPTYHLRRYVGGDSYGTLTPGNWDLGSLGSGVIPFGEKLKAFLGFFGLSSLVGPVTIYDVDVAVDAGSGSFVVQHHFGQTTVDALAALEIDVDLLSRVQLLASSTLGGPRDLALATSATPTAADFDVAPVIGATTVYLIRTDASGNDAVFASGTLTGTPASSCNATYGFSCPGSGGVLPTLSVDGCATVGSDITVGIGTGVGGASALIFLGLAEATVPMGFGCTLNTAPLLPVTVGPLPLSNGGPGEGQISFGATIPMNATPATIYLQAFVTDPGGAGGFSSTNGVELKIQ